MTVSELCNDCHFNPVCLPEPEREVCGAYIGDLLSWVMGRAQSGNVWITIMSNVNVIAVASLSDVSCVLLAEGVTLDDELVETARQKGINLLSTELSAFCAAEKIIGKV